MKMRTRERLSSITMVERSDQRMERSGLERSGHGTKWPKDGTKWFGTKWSWNEVAVILEDNTVDKRSTKLNYS